MIIDLKKNDLEKQAELEEKFPGIFLNHDIKTDFDNNPYTNYTLYLIEEKIVGFINYYLIYDRIEIVNFNVLDYFQNKHIASSLLEQLISLANKEKIKNITLEVRSDNEKAIYLYHKYGFKEVAIRKNYYNDTDGILMEKELI